MRKALPGFLALAIAAGCADQSAVQRANQRAEFNKAVAIYNEAQKAWVPKDKEPKGANDERTPDLGLYREERLAEAASVLQKASVAPEHQAAVSRMLADVQLAQARYTSRVAMTEWAGLAERSSRLVSLLAALDSASVRAVESNVDKTEVIKELSANRADVQKNIAADSAKIADLKKQITALQSQVDKLSADSKASLEASQKLRQEAFTKSGKEQNDTYIKATEADRASAKAAAEAASLAIRADVLKAEAAILERRVALDKEAIAATQAQVDSTKKVEETLKALHTQALKDRDDAAAKLKKSVSEIAAAYEEIDKKFQAADAFAEASVKTLLTSKGAGQRATDMDQLNKTISRAHVLSMHASARGSMTSTLELVAKQSKRSMGDIADFENLAKSARAELEKLSNDALGVLSDGQGLYAKLAQGGSPDDHGVLDDMKIALDNYKARVDATRTLATVAPQPIVKATPPPTPKTEETPATAPGTGPTSAPAETAPAEKAS